MGPYLHANIRLGRTIPHWHGSWGIPTGEQISFNQSLTFSRSSVRNGTSQSKPSPLSLLSSPGSSVMPTRAGNSHRMPTRPLLLSLCFSF